ncbi:MAG: peptide-methionine (S)-S-oxide reductase MsrA [Clostridia bacterium]|nr:peptide-methionine (S)-S-oxide reductase MsrA [Clostridia bacterium]
MEAYFAGGCFWCITPPFRAEPGVTGVVSGYSGGSEQAPAYEDVKAQRTGHRETVRVDFDPDAVSYERLVDLFLENIDPFDAGGQFIDRGASYTAAIYYTDADQERIARAKLAVLAERCGHPAAVALEPFRGFWRAEEYHQDYDLKNPEAFREELISSGRKSR